MRIPSEVNKLNKMKQSRSLLLYEGVRLVYSYVSGGQLEEVWRSSLEERIKRIFSESESLRP